MNYYFNSETLESQWDHPCDEYYRQIYILEKERKAVEDEAKKQMKAAEEEAKKQLHKEKKEAEIYSPQQKNFTNKKILPTKKSGGKIIKL